MTIAIERLREVVRDFGRRHIAYHMARELLEIYKGTVQPVWNSCIDVLPESNGNYLVMNKGTGQHTACYDCDSNEWRGSTGTLIGVTHWMDLPKPPKPEVK